MWNNFFFLLLFLSFFDEKHGNVIPVSSENSLFEASTSCLLMIFFLFSLDYFCFYPIYDVFILVF